MEGQQTQPLPLWSRLAARWQAFRSHPRVRRAVRHPLFAMWVVVVFSLLVEEQYPFSDFPMYSAIASGSHYFYLTDENDAPLPTRPTFGESASAIKKMYHDKLTPLAEKRSDEAGERIKASDLGPEDQALAGEPLLDKLFRQAEKRDWGERVPPPKEVRLVRVDIHRSDKELSEEKRVVLTRAVEAADVDAEEESGSQEGDAKP